MCKNLRNMCYVEPVVEVSEPNNDEVSIIDDVSAFETLCPVSSVTGHRSNPLDALQMVLKPSEARLVQEVLQDLPNSGVPSDTGDFSMIVERLECGTDAERSKYLNKLSSIADDLYRIQPLLKPMNDFVEFEKKDKEIVDNV